MGCGYIGLFGLFFPWYWVSCLLSAEVFLFIFNYVWSQLFCNCVDLAAQHFFLLVPFFGFGYLFSSGDKLWTRGNEDILLFFLLKKICDVNVLDYYFDKNQTICFLIFPATTIKAQLDLMCLLWFKIIIPWLFCCHLCELCLWCRLYVGDDSILQIIWLVYLYILHSLLKLVLDFQICILKLIASYALFIIWFVLDVIDCCIKH